MTDSTGFLDHALPDQGRPVTKTALAVDLDGSLCKSDTLHDSIIGLLVDRPILALQFTSWLKSGKAGFKAKIADHFQLDPQYLPYDPDVLARVQAARAEGRETVLVSASDHRAVEAVARHLQVFDHSVGTGSADTDGTNLSGASKARWLEARYGKGGYDYIGDSSVDLPVWTSARTAIAVRPSKTLHSAARRQGVELVESGPQDPGWREWLRPRLRALRPHQWAKNLLVFIPALAAHEIQGLAAALVAFLAFSLTASAVYILNDLADLSADRAHPRKRRRPFAAGLVPVGDGLAAAFGLLVVATAVSMILAPAGFTLILGLYLVATFAYSLWLKRKTLVDIIALAGLYTLRIVGGAAAAGVVLSPWLMAFSMFIFFSLAAVKRQAELVDMERSGRGTMAGRGYIASDLPVIRSMGITSGQAAVLVLALYANSSDVAELYARPEVVWLICPIVFYWLSRIQLLTHRGHMADDPIVFALRDRRSLLAAVITAGLLALAVTGWGIG